MKLRPFLALFGICLALSATAASAQITRINNKIPPEIMTPDTVQTRIGTLKFFDGFPTKETSQLVSDHLDFIRGVEVSFNFVPAARSKQIRRGLVQQGLTQSNPVMITERCTNSNPLS